MMIDISDGKSIVTAHVMLVPKQKETVIIPDDDDGTGIPDTNDTIPENEETSSRKDAVSIPVIITLLMMGVLSILLMAFTIFLILSRKAEEQKSNEDKGRQ